MLRNRERMDSGHVKQAEEWERRFREMENKLDRAARTIGELDAERWALQKVIEGNMPAACAWLMAKVASQRRALNQMNVRAVSRRLALRAFAEAGYVLTPEQWAEARSKFTHPSTGRASWAERLPKDAPREGDE